MSGVQQSVESFIILYAVEQIYTIIQQMVEIIKKELLETLGNMIQPYICLGSDTIRA